MGTSYERSNIGQRIIHKAVILGGPKCSAHAYRMIESNDRNLALNTGPAELRERLRCARRG